LKNKVFYFFVCTIIFICNASLAGNMSIYSITEGTINEGLANITTGDENVAIGNEALSGNTSGDHNTAVGDEAMKSNTTGANNTAIGRQALYSNTSGSKKRRYRQKIS
jgi:hypothetical protein